ncbi:MAG: ATP-binding protein [Candidatus Binatia bacterium]
MSPHRSARSRQAANRREAARSDPFSILVEVGTALCGTLHLRELLAAMMARAREVLDAEACSIMLVDAPSRTLRWEVALGAGAGKLQTLSVPLGQGISGRVAATGEAIRIEDAQNDRRWEGRRYDAETGFTTHSILCVPIQARGRCIGVIQVLNRRGGPFSDEDQRLLEALAGMGGVAIENARLYENLEEKVQERTTALSRTLAALRDTQAQLVQSEKMAALGDLVAGVAHEINTPLGAVASNTDLISRALAKAHEAFGAAAPADKVRALLDKAARMTNVSRDACQRIGQIVRSLRNFARLDEAERKPADLHEGLESTLTLVAHLLKGRITLEREYGQLPPVPCYPNQLNQVFLNVLVNAAQAIDGTGRITIRTRWVPGSSAAGGTAASAVVEITDTGRGIPPAMIKKIFDPGFTTKGVGVGTGLGLAICYRIVANHKGKIEVDSEVGEGTTFRIVLPVPEAV